MRPETRIKLNRFKPREYQLPIFDAIENKGYKKALCVMPRRCLSGNTHILMANGSYKLLKDIEGGDLILSFNGERAMPDVVVNAWSAGEKKTKTVMSQCNPELITSEDHVFANASNMYGAINWNKISEIKDKKKLVVYNGFNGTTINNLEIAEFIGFMLCNGSISRYKIPKFTSSSVKILKQVESLVGFIFGYKAIWKKNGRSYDLSLTSAVSGGIKHKDFIKEMFRDGEATLEKKEKKFLSAVWNYDFDSTTRLFASIISCFGTIEILESVRPKVSIVINCKKHYRFCWEMYWLLRKHRLLAKVPFLGKGSNWTIEIDRPIDIKKLLSSGPIYGKEKDQELALYLVKKAKIAKPKEHALSRFKIKDGDIEETYDIETRWNNNFFANGYLVHNSGKDIAAFNLAIRQLIKKVCTIFYIFPTYSQARKALWDAITIDGRRILDFIPEELIESKNGSEMKIVLTNGSTLQFIGSDNYDRLVGTNPYGCIFSEYALQDPRAYQFIRPILAANNGWCLFISTPRAKNHMWALYQIAKESKEWFCYKLTLDDTKHIPLREIERERSEGIMSEDLIMQEYYTSFNAGVEGAFYTKYLDKMRLNNQISSVPWESSFPVHTAWDIGVRDSTVIIFFQTIGQTVRIIDCYENSKVGLEHYVTILRQKDYNYGKHIAPHDIAVREFGSGMTRLEKAKRLGIKFVTAPRISIEDGIEAVRSSFSKIWIDDKKCEKLIKALESYRQEWDSKKQVYKATILHDWSSHFCDAARYLCITLPKTRDGLSPEELDRRYNEAMYGSQSNLPSIFRTDLPKY